MRSAAQDPGGKARTVHPAGHLIHLQRDDSPSPYLGNMESRGHRYSTPMHPAPGQLGQPAPHNTTTPVHMQLGEFINSSPEVQDLLKKSKDDTKSLRTAHEMERSLYYATARSGYAAEGTEAESIMGDEEFTFDPEIINTPAYRRAFQSRRRAISSERHYIEPVTPLPPASTSGAKESSPRLSRLFSGTSNKREFKTSSSSIATGATTDAAQASMISSTLVEPVGDAVIRGDEAVTATTVRNARSKFYDAMALHREILAMKFVDQSYQSVVEQKVQTRNAVLEELQRALSLDTGFTVEEDRLVKELKYVLLPKLTGDLQQSSGAISGI